MMKVEYRPLWRQDLATGIFFYLDKAYFQETIFNQSKSKLLNNNIFKNYFRGIYFKAEQIGDKSVMGKPKFGEGLNINYLHDYSLNSSGEIIMDVNGDQGKI